MKNGLALKGFTSNHQKLMQFSSIFHEKGQQRLEKERRRQEFKASAMNSYNNMKKEQRREFQHVCWKGIDFLDFLKVSKRQHSG
jgi:hypothetical protein